MAGPDEERLRRLEERLDRASAAAERLAAEAAASAAGGAAGGAADASDRKPPPAGWQVPEGDDAERGEDELDAMMALLRSLRDRIPPDLQQRLVTALRELLEAIRALLDWYLERLERPRHQPAEVQDIPIL
jgi:hypothetical protein